jgi:hypothetical protein
MLLDVGDVGFNVGVKVSSMNAFENRGIVDLVAGEYFAYNHDPPYHAIGFQLMWYFD